MSKLVSWSTAILREYIRPNTSNNSQGMKKWSIRSAACRKSLSFSRNPILIWVSWKCTQQSVKTVKWLFRVKKITSTPGRWSLKTAGNAAISEYTTQEWAKLEQETGLCYLTIRKPRMLSLSHSLIYLDSPEIVIINTDLSGCLSIVHSGATGSFRPTRSISSTPTVSQTSLWIVQQINIIHQTGLHISFA